MGPSTSVRLSRISASPQGGRFSVSRQCLGLPQGVKRSQGLVLGIRHEKLGDLNHSRSCNKYKKTTVGNGEMSLNESQEIVHFDLVLLVWPQTRFTNVELCTDRRRVYAYNFTV